MGDVREVLAPLHQREPRFGCRLEIAAGGDLAELGDSFFSGDFPQNLDDEVLGLTVALVKTRHHRVLDLRAHVFEALRRVPVRRLGQQRHERLDGARSLRWSRISMAAVRTLRSESFSDWMATSTTSPVLHTPNALRLSAAHPDIGVVEQAPPASWRFRRGVAWAARRAGA